MILLVAGTGTSVGKTTFSASLLRRANSAGMVPPWRAWKPVETGDDSDSSALAAASGSLIPAMYSFAPAVSPHLAARLAHTEISIAAIAERARALAVDATLLMEMAGGLFTPLNDDGKCNADLASAIGPEHVFLVAPNRLGVLHDVRCCRQAASSLGLRFSATILTTFADHSDPSTASNLIELSRFQDDPVVDSVGGVSLALLLCGFT